MIRIKLIYISFVAILISLSGCESYMHDDSNNLEGDTQNAPLVYLSVTKAHAAGMESFNDDITDYEDRIHDLAMLVFDSSTGAKVCEYFDEGIPSSEKDKSFVVQLTPGVRDFYFVANMPMAVLKNISTKIDMDLYMDTFLELDQDLYLNATEAKGFPMSRIYNNQIVSEGGNIYSPLPFRPNGEDEVKLIRVIAKLEVNIEGSDVGVKNIYYKNAFREFSLISPLAPVTPVYYEDKPLRKVGNTYIYYMPEALMSSPLWGVLPTRRPINYFLIETLNGTYYEIPVISYEGGVPGSDYLSFAYGNLTDKPDYNIYRNRHYYYTIKKLQTIEIIYSIDPWQVKESSIYMGYGYNVETDENGKVIVSNTVEACDPHNIRFEAIDPFQFSGGLTEQTFNNSDPNASVEYSLSPTPTVGSGEYLRVYYNNVLVKSFSK